jgi:hypothetical protein
MVLLILEFSKVFKHYQCHFLCCSIQLFNLIIVGVHHESTQPIENIVNGVVLHVKNELEDFSLVDKVVRNALVKQTLVCMKFLH